jgi:hypothetical protein
MYEVSICVYMSMENKSFSFENSKTLCEGVANILIIITYLNNNNVDAFVKHNNLKKKYDIQSVNERRKMLNKQSLSLAFELNRKKHSNFEEFVNFWNFELCSFFDRLFTLIL